MIGWAVVLLKKTTQQVDEPLLVLRVSEEIVLLQCDLSFFSVTTIFIELPITRTPDNSNFFRFPLKVRVIGGRLYFFLIFPVDFNRVDKKELQTTNCMERIKT